MAAATATTRKGENAMKTITACTTVLTLFLGGVFLLSSMTAASAQQMGNAENGKKLYEKKRCELCHMIAGKGKPSPGPDLTKEGTKGHGIPWQIAFLKDPKSKNPKSIMPPVKDLSDKEILDLATYLESLK
jgi:mono/diheme cytochrome c family protein